MKLKWCNIEQKWCDLKHKWCDLELGTDVILSKKWCDLGINHTAKSQSDCTDSQSSQSGCNKSPYFIISATSPVYVAADENKIYNPVML